MCGWYGEAAREIIDDRIQPVEPGTVEVTEADGNGIIILIAVTEAISASCAPLHIPFELPGSLIQLTNHFLLSLRLHRKQNNEQ